MRSLFTAALLLALSVPALASSDRWTEVRSPHFTVLTNSSEKEGRRVADQFEHMRAVFHMLLPEGVTDTHPITVVALKNQDSFEALEPKADLAKGKATVAGMFLRATDGSYILLRLDATSEEHRYASIYHEYTHFLTRHSEALPVWISEGLAEFYENTEIGETRVKIGEPNASYVYHLTGMRLLPLSTLFSVGYDSPEYHNEKTAFTFYGESWALTHLLIVNDRQNKTHHLQEYFADLGQGQDSVTAAKSAFGNLDKLQQELEAYINHANFSMFEMATPATVDPSTFKVSPASTVEADAIRAGVLALTDRKSEALALLDNVLREDPNNLLAQETLGKLDMQNNEPAAARKWYDQAVQQHPSSYEDYYYAAYLAMRLGDTSNDAASIESNLLSAIKINPAFAPALDLLADFYCVRREKLDDAHKYIAQAIQLEPENVRYRVDDAAIFVQRKQPESALIVLKEAERFAKTPKDTALIQARRDKINQANGSN